MLEGNQQKHVVYQTHRSIWMIALGVMVLLSIPVFVVSQNEGLTWGFDAGEKHYFKETNIQIQNSSTTASLSFSYYIITRDNYTIPDPLTYFPFARGEPFFYNDTPVMAGYLSFAVPIGNWDILETLFLSLSSGYYDTSTIINDETTWGFQTTKNLADGVESRKSIFSKTDGVLLSFLYENAHDFGYTIRIIIEKVAPPLVINNIILVAGGSVIFIGLLGAYFFKRLRGS